MVRFASSLLILLLANTVSWAGCPTCTNPNLPAMDGDAMNGVLDVRSVRMNLAVRGSMARSVHQSTDALSASGAGDHQGRSERAWDYLMVATTLDVEHAASTYFGWALTVPMRYMSVTEDEAHSESTASTGGHAHPATHLGLADISIYGTVYRRSSAVSPWWLNGRVGLTLPTGNTLADPNQAVGEPEGHEHIFFGSGTVDPRALVTLGYQFTDWTLRASGHLRTALYDNTHGYRGGTQTGGGLAVLSGFGLSHWTFGFRAEGFYAAPARWSESGVEDLFSGKSGYLTGVEASFRGDAWDLSLGVDVPFITSTVDGTFRVPAILKTGVGYEL